MSAENRIPIRRALVSVYDKAGLDDLVRGLILLAESGEHMPVNIGNPSEMSLLELAEAVLAATGSSSQIVYEALPVDDPQVRQPDITRARQLLGWEPEVSFEQLLALMVEADLKALGLIPLNGNMAFSGHDVATVREGLQGAFS